MAPVNTAGTYRLAKGAILTIDVDGTPYTIECAASSIGIVADENTVDHPRTGCKAPYTETIDASYSLVLSYMMGYGTDGIVEVFAAIEGQNVAWRLQTGPTASAEFPVFDWTGSVPFLDPFSDTEYGEFAAGSFTSYCDAKPVKTIVQPTTMAAGKAKAAKS